MVHLWLRAETKKNEHRSALTPSACEKLKAQGFQITVEKSVDRTFDDSEYSNIGCTLVEPGTWKSAPADAYIVGLKELPENDSSPLVHKHIFFGHCYKQQAGWKDLLGRFVQGNGLLLDLEFLTDANGRRMAAFGYHAGFAGTAIGLEAWAQQQLEPTKPLGVITPYPNQDLLIAHIKERLAAAIKKTGGNLPRVIVIGALGRCGTGACDFARMAGIPETSIIKWDMKETARGGPFPEILGNEIFVNCIYLSQKIPPFLTLDMLNEPTRALSVVVDVSCDTTNPNNPIPIYTTNSTFDEPTLPVTTKVQKPMDVVSIDHLPTLLPREASETFCNDLVPSLMELKNREEARVWKEVDQLFRKKVAEMNADQ